MLHAADASRFNNPGNVTVTDDDVIDASAAIAKQIAPLIAAMLRVEIGMQPKDFLRTDGRGCSFEGALNEFLQTAISEALEYTGRDL